MRDLDIQIHDYIEATSEPVALDEVWNVAVGAGPVRPLTRREEEKPRNRGWLITGAAAALVLLIFGIVPFVSFDESTRPPAVIPTVSTMITVPESRVVEGSTDRQGPPFKDANPGAVEWIQIELDPYVDGFAGAPPTVQRDIDGYVISGNGVLTYSHDGRSWTTDPLSPELAGYQAFTSRGQWAVAGTGEWQQSTTDSRVLLRSDGTRWRRVDLPDSESSWPELPIVSGTSSLVPQGGAEGSFWVSNGDGPFQMHDAPWDWPPATAGGYSSVGIVAAPDGGFVALVTYYGIHPDDSELADNERDASSTLRFAELWTSPDGVLWDNNGLPGFLAADALNRSLNVTIRSHGDELVASASYNGGERRDTGQTVLGNYTSRNGIDWAPSSGIDPTDFGESECWVHTMNMGYICASIRTEPETMFEILLSTDGETWVDVNLPEIDYESYGFVGGAGHGGVGDILFLSYGDMWIGLFE